MAIIQGASSPNTGANVDAGGSVQTGLYDAAGNPVVRTRNGIYSSTDRHLPVGGVVDGAYRPARMDRSGALASATYTPAITFNLFTNATPPSWVAAFSTMTETISTTYGVLLNAASSGAAASYAALLSLASVAKLQRAPLHFRSRSRVVLGGTNGQADWGLSSTQAPSYAVLPAACVFLAGADGTLKPTIYVAGAIDVQGADIIAASGLSAATISAKYYVWDIVVDDSAVTFTMQDPATGAVLNEQVLAISANDSRFGGNVAWFAHHRAFVAGGAANAGTAVQLYLADCQVGILDAQLGKPWPHLAAMLGMGGVVSPVTSLTQLSNYASSTAPALATLSNTAAGYTNLGGQFQFATVAGAETDYALFGFQVPTGVKFVCTGINIDSVNTGAAVAGSATWLQWFLGVDGLTVSLATNNYRIALGNQTWPVGAAIGVQGNVLAAQFVTPLVTNSGRFFHVGFKMPLGTATAAQVMRGTVRAEGYFE